MAIVELLSTMVMMGNSARTAVSMSMPTDPKAKSPMTLITCLSGSAILAPMASPRL